MTARLPALRNENFQVDFEESRAQHRFVVKLGVDEELDRSKKSCLVDYILTVCQL